MNKLKSPKFLDKLTTKRLLSYYKARKKDLYKLISRNTCECCGQLSWELDSKDKSNLKDKEEFYELNRHLKVIKLLLDKREHVKK